MTNELDEKWYDNITVAAIHLSLSNYCMAQPSSRHDFTHLSKNTTTKLETLKNEFMENHGGMIIVDICQSSQYEVVVETNDCLTSIKLQRESLASKKSSTILPIPFERTR